MCFVDNGACRFLRKTLGWFLLSTLFFGSVNCSKDKIVQSNLGVEPKISSFIFPAVLYNLSSAEKLVAITVNDPQGLSNIEMVTFEISKKGEGPILLDGILLDEGKDGDIIANDGVFSFLLRSGFSSGETGQFEMSVTATDYDGNDSETETVLITIVDGGEPIPPRILTVNAPLSVAVDSSSSIIITALVTDSDGLSDVNSVTAAFYPSGFSEPTFIHQLFDHGEIPDFLANDGLFTTTFDSDTTITKLFDYFVRVQAKDLSGNASQPVVAVIRGREAITGGPKILSVNYPPMINGLSVADVLFEAEVSDPNGLTNVSDVSMRLFDANNVELPISPAALLDDGAGGDRAAGDGVFSATVAFSESGSTAIEYNLRFSAVDNEGNVASNVDRLFVIGFSDAPYITNVQAPAEVVIDPVQDQIFLISVDARDPQGLADISSVLFRSFLPNGNEAQSSPFTLFDDGFKNGNDRADAVAGDGIYSSPIFLLRNQQLKGEFRFEFVAIDSDGNMSQILKHIMQVE